MKHLWLIAVAICAIIAGYFLFSKNYDIAFVFGVLGIVAWFINIRQQVKQKLVELDEEDSISNEDSNEEDYRP
jgi:hypothetical protein